ncbi:rhodanese-like domain-containing protein [Psychrobacter sp. I-STPA6b]|uniref:rhodanese-like domain-containing protein n=1 Tax=Psychrobacter sp. I-STPA6b TaxID=2585718 RepID=UPI001D0C6CD7|nr:rhodanese-like domain-containing protein [Psychrobacter sp. I-STPA6b]
MQSYKKSRTVQKLERFGRILALMVGVGSVSAISGIAQAQTVWVDVRTPAEFATGHVVNAKNLPYENIVSLAVAQGYDKDDTILLYCRSGHRAGIARRSLLGAGYQNVQNLGGFDDLVETGAVKVNQN